MPVDEILGSSVIVMTKVEMLVKSRGGEDIHS